MRRHSEKVRALIERFPWGTLDFPKRKKGHETDLLHIWITESILRDANVTGLVLTNQIDPIVRAVQQTVCSGKPQRFVAKIDASHLTKSPASILEKMAREWDDVSAPKIGFADIQGAFSDLARFRVVVNFLSDALAVREAIEAPFNTMGMAPLSDAQATLAREFSLKGNCFDDSVTTRVAQRKSGERSYKGVFQPRANAATVKVEVQIQTLLQESWDKKQHVLVYEPTRRGELVPEAVQCELDAMSDLLFVADRTFDRYRAQLQGTE